jgi:hypothetical protein
MKLTKQMFLGAIFSIAMILGGCGSSGSDNNDIQMSGLVTDARVSGATIYVYSDKDMSALIGSGTTNSSGEFDITLTGIKTEPSIVYCKTVGGVNIDDKMPAPTMTFVGTKDSESGKYNISPISQALYEKVLRGEALSTAKTQLETELEGAVGTTFSESDLFSDPIADTNRKKALDKILASGTSTVSLSDGNYSVIALIYSQMDILDDDNITNIDELYSTRHLKKFNMNIKNSFITGDCGDASHSCDIKGSVSGSNILINFISSGEVTKIAGTVGLFGSASGTFVDMDSSGINKGVFAAQFIPTNPSSVINYANMETKIADMIKGPVSYIFRDYIGNSPNIVPGSADLNITDYNTSTHTFTTTGFSNHVDNNSTSSGFNGANMGVPFVFKAGKLLEVDGHITSLALFQYQVDGNNDGTGEGDYTYLVKPIGIRSGVDMLVRTDNKLVAVGDAIFNRSDVIAPRIESGENSMKVYVVGPQNLNQPKPILALSSSINLPSGDTSSGIVRTNSSNITITLSKGVVAMYSNLNSTMNQTTDLVDYLRFLQLSNTGAFQGENIQGGKIGGKSLSNWPMPFVGNMHKSSGGIVPIKFTGTIQLHYLARTLYTTDTDIGDYSEFRAGTIQIEGDNATLSIQTTSEGNLDTALTYNLTSEFDSSYGIYHIYGDTGGTITDIYWAVGSTKAVYTSTYSTSDTRIREVGEAFLSF